MHFKIGCIMIATEDEEYVPEKKAVSGLNGWIDCFPKAEFGGPLFCGGISDPGEANGKSVEQEEAYQFGKAIN